jgi:hypothetical protein
MIETEEKIKRALVYSGKYCVWFTGSVHVLRQHCLLLVVLREGSGCLCCIYRKFPTITRNISTIM